MNRRFVALVVVISMMDVGCRPAPKSGKGFTLPDGDVYAGKTVYINMQCSVCHQIGVVKRDDATAEMSIKLGGEVSRIKTYGELVTSIINPSHKLAKGYSHEETSLDGESKMKSYNDVLTVSQLIDLVAFIQSEYELLEYEPTDYPVYGP